MIGKKIVISLGGSLIAPSGGVSTDFLAKLNTFVRGLLQNDPMEQFFLVVGGGSTAKSYIDVGKNIIGQELSDEDIDWIGTRTTRLNAYLIRTIFKDIAHPYIIKDYEIIRRVDEPVVVAAGWKPGWSTDFCATMICEDYEVKTILYLSSLNYFFDKDPKIHKDAKPILKITWSKFRKIVGDTWTLKVKFPFDPIASKKAQELGLKVVVLKGDDFKNIKNYMDGKKFIGTVIEG